MGHRGAAGLAPENTLASCEAAIAAGCERVEVDLRLSSDGHAVVVHDADLARVGPPGLRGRRVGELTRATLRRVDVGAALGRPGCPIPALDELLDALGSRVATNLEIKGRGAAGRAVVTAVLRVLSSRRAARERTVVSSFSAPVVHDLARLAPAVPRALLVAPARSGAEAASRVTTRRRLDGAVKRAVELGCEALHPHASLVDHRLVAACREAGLRVRVWTVDDARVARRLAGLGVDGLVTNRPDRLARALRSPARAGGPR